MEKLRQDYEDKSYWLGLTPYTENPHLVGDLEVDVAVLGGGYTGLSCAHFLRRENPGVKVAVLESEVVGFGASGRNAGFVTPMFGYNLPATAALFGNGRAARAWRYAADSVELVDQLIREHKIECDWERTGLLRVATSPAWRRRLQDEVALARRLGMDAIEWIDAQEARIQVDSPRFLGAWSDKRAGLLDPARFAWGLRSAIERMGTQVYEHTPAIGIDRVGKRFLVRTPHGKVRAERLVLATNVWSHLWPTLRRAQIPAFLHCVLTEPLGPERLARLGWKRRQGVEEVRFLSRHARLTRDGRVLVSGRDLGISFGKAMEREDEAIYRSLQEDLVRTFPVLRGVQFTHRWGGLISVPLQLVPAVGYVGDRRAVYALGCLGHGVALSVMNGWTLADLLLERHTERTEPFFVNRTVLPWPPEPLRLATKAAARGLARLADWIFEGRPHARA